MPPTKRKTPGKAEQERRKNQLPLQAPNQSASPEYPHSKKDLGRGGGWQRGETVGVDEITLPSGSTCLVKRAQIPDLIATGALEKIDLLTPMVDRDLVQKARGRRKPAANELTFATMKPEEMLAAFEMADRVTAAVVVDPPVRLAPTPKCRVCKWEGSEFADHQPDDKHQLALVPRDPDVFYTDGIDVQDKMTILNRALGGLRGLENFRGVTDESVADVETKPSLENNTS